MEVGAHIVIRGLVQGVGFRYFAYVRATKLGLTGSTRNLYNGDVEVYIEGDRSLIEEFIKEMKAGPRSARVTDVRCIWQKKTGIYGRFEIH